MCIMGPATLLVTAALLSAKPVIADTRPVNISGAWYLPDMDSSVFLRHFREKVTWPEAESICKKHHGTLATVEGSRDFDATRFYLLREGAGASGSVWIGLRRARPGGDFVWTNSHPMSMEGGYWLESPPMHSSSPLCVALDPSADFRWRARSCGPESLATFLCQLPVPLWVGRGEGGCLPSLPPSSALPMSWLTIQYLPDQGALDLTADCGSRGQRQLACKKGTTTGEELGWRLSCSEDLKLHMDDFGMRQRRGRPQTHAPPTRHRRDLTGTSMTTTQASSPSQMPLEAHSVPLPSPIPSDPLGTTLSPLQAPSSPSPEPTEGQNITLEVSSAETSSSAISSSAISTSVISSSADSKSIPISAYVTSSTNTTAQSPGLNLPTSRPTPTHNLTVSLTVVISPASSEENITNEVNSENSASPPSGEVFSISNISEDSSQSPSNKESEDPSKPAPKSISIDVVYIELTSLPTIVSQKPETMFSDGTTPRASSVSFTPKSPPILDESTLSSIPVSISTLSLHPEMPQASSESISQPETQKPSSSPLTQLNPVSALPMKVAPETSNALHASFLNPLPLTSLLTSPTASEIIQDAIESSTQTESTSSAPESSSPYVPDTRVDILDGYSSDSSNPAPKNIRITAVISNDVDDKVEDDTKQEAIKDSLKDQIPVDVSQNEVLKQGNEEDGYQWIKVSAEKEPSERPVQEGAQSTDETSKDGMTLTVLSSEGITTGQGAVSSTDDRVGHVEFDGEWTEVGTLDPVSEKFLEERDEVDSDLSSPPPRPNRSRKLTRPQGRSFYTYFLSRVLG